MKELMLIALIICVIFFIWYMVSRIRYYKTRREAISAVQDLIIKQVVDAANKVE